MPPFTENNFVGGKDTSHKADNNYKYFDWTLSNHHRCKEYHEAKRTDKQVVSCNKKIERAIKKQILQMSTVSTISVDAFVL